MLSRAVYFLAAAASLGVAAPAMAELNAGYEAWNRGDYKTAVREWRDLAAKGNADAQFNMAQAYRLGRGVEQNSKQAEVLIAKAAAQGHIKATDTYGLLLFQSGRREEAMPYVIKAAERGNPRAQYLLGIGHFNGDLVGKDWVRAYALMTLSNSAGFKQAKPAIAQMDDFIPLKQRQEAQLVAQQLKKRAETNLASQMAASDLGVTLAPGATAPQRVATPRRTSVPSPARRIPQPIQTMKVPPSVAAAQAAVSEAARVTGTESPAQAGADFVKPAPSVRPAPTRVAPARVAQVTPPKPPVRRAASTPASSPKPRRAPSANGPWRVQLGAFGVRSNADRLWGRLSGNSAISGKKKFVVPAGRVVKLQVGGYTSRSSAQTACSALKRGGQDCIVTK